MKKNPYKINPFLRLLVKVWMFFFTRYFRITADITSEISNLNQPYLLLSNHCGRYDPFILNHYLKKAPNFVSSDAILRDKVIGTIFKMFGAMGIKKGTRDSAIIREMAKVVQSGGALALFPEATRTWTGETNNFDISIVKLIRLLKVPIITAVMRGSYFFDPRWGKKIRRSAMHIEFKMAFKPEDLKNLTDEQIFETLKRNLYHNDIAYQRQRLVEIESETRAENIEFICYQCPACLQYDGFNSSGNDFTCRSCANVFTVDNFGFIGSKTDFVLPFDNTFDWLNWQGNNFAQLVKKQILNHTNDVLFTSERMRMECAVGYEDMQILGEGRLEFYADKLVLVLDNSTETLPIAEISALSPQYQERIELFFGDKAYRFTSIGAKESGLKWEIAISMAWVILGQSAKVSPYFKELVLRNSSSNSNQEVA